LANKYEILGQYVVVKLSNCDDEMLCNASDWDKHKGITWRKSPSGYAYAVSSRKTGRKTIYFHAEIASDIGVAYVKHKNSNKLDNRRINFKPSKIKCKMICDGKRRSVLNITSKTAKNNTSGCKGVFYDNSSKKWRSFIQIDHKYIWIGSYLHKINAIKARKQAEKIYHEPLLQKAGE